MESKQLQNAWLEVCDQVKSYPNVAPSQVTAFFSRLAPQAMSEDFLMLTADTEFIKTWIEQHYLDHIKQALLDLRGIEFTVAIEVDPTAQQAAEPKVEPDQARSAQPESKQPPARGGVDQPVIQKQERPTAPAEEPDRAGTLPPSRLRAIEDLPVPAEDRYLSADDRIELDASPTSSLTFENFVIGDSNRMAYSMAVAVAEAPGRAHLNPLFIYGKSGLGKTHLLRAIQNYIRETMPHLSTIYVDSAEFLSDYTEAAAGHDKEKSSYRNFKQRYEEADVLLIDDVITTGATISECARILRTVGAREVVCATLARARG